MSEARISAFIWVPLTKVVVLAEPLKLTTELWINPEPFTVKVNAGPPAVAEEGLSEAMLGTGLLPVPPPGAPRFAAASSITSTQSLPFGAVKLCDPLFGNVPMRVAAPVRGAYHQAMAVEDVDVIADMLIVLAVAFPSDRYAMIVWPSDVRDATERVDPEPNPAVRTVWLVSGTISQCSRLRNRAPINCWLSDPGEPSWLCHEGLVSPLLVALKDQIGPLPNKRPR